MLVMVVVRVEVVVDGRSRFEILKESTFTLTNIFMQFCHSFFVVVIFIAMFINNKNE